MGVEQLFGFNVRVYDFKSVWEFVFFDYRRIEDQK